MKKELEKSYVQKYLLVELAQSKEERQDIIVNVGGKDYKAGKNAIKVLNTLNGSEEGRVKFHLFDIDRDNAHQIFIAMLKNSMGKLSSGKIYGLVGTDVNEGNNLKEDRFELVVPAIYFGEDQVGTIEIKDYFNAINSDKDVLEFVNFGDKKTNVRK